MPWRRFRADADDRGVSAAHWDTDGTSPDAPEPIADDNAGKSSAGGLSPLRGDSDRANEGPGKPANRDLAIPKEERTNSTQHRIMFRLLASTPVSRSEITDNPASGGGGDARYGIERGIEE